MPEVDFLAKYQSATKRDYVGRVTEHDKAECAAIAKKWGEEYWDGPRQYGYGGYKYDGRWLPFAQDIARHYGLKAGDRVLDVGCGKAFLLYELTRAVPGLEVAGLDISAYGIEHAKEEVRPNLKIGNCVELPYPSHSFDFVFSINTFHNLKIDELKRAVQEVERVGKDKKWICVEVLPQRAREGEPALLAADLHELPHARGMGLAVSRMGLHRRLRLHLFRIGRRGR